jgi:hypothetical protein
VNAASTDALSSPEPAARPEWGTILPGDPPQFQRFIAGTRPIDLGGIDWDAIPSHPLSPEVLRVLTYMQDVESHTVVFPRTIFSQRAVDDEHIGTFLVCWLYEEGMHGRALARFLSLAGHPVPPRRKGRTTPMDRLERVMTTAIAAAWKDFLALHMAWGALHECTTIHAYQRLIDRNDHPVLNELLRRIIHDEARHFAFYMWQAERLLAAPRVARRVRWIMERRYVPVGATHQPDALARWVSGYLFDGDAGREAARRIDRTFAKLPGFESATLLGDWLERKVYG